MRIYMYTISRYTIKNKSFFAKFLELFVIKCQITLQEHSCKIKG